MWNCAPTTFLCSYYISNNCGTHCRWQRHLLPVVRRALTAPGKGLSASTQQHFDHEPLKVHPWHGQCQATRLCGIEGLRADLNKVTAIARMQAPKELQEILNLLGMANFYYRSSISDFAKISEPIVAPTRKHAHFHWTQEHQQAFDLLKEELARDTVMTHPRLWMSLRSFPSRAISSAKSRSANSLSYHGIPWSLLCRVILMTKSISRQNKNGERMHPCLTPSWLAIKEIGLSTFSIHKTLGVKV